MTATEVNGVAVVDDQPRAAPFADRGGRVIYQQQTRVLTLADGSVVYGCAHCDYTSENPNSIRPHLGKHNSRRIKTGPATGNALNLPLAELIRRLDSVDSLSNDVQEWKTRALRAERRLKQLRIALGVTEKPTP